jgi:hypothetical protein
MLIFFLFPCICTAQGILSTSTGVHGQASSSLDSSSVLFKSKIVALGLCGSGYLGEDGFLLSIHQTNAYFFNSSVFKNIIFVKVEQCSRYDLESILFFNTLNDSEKIEILSEPQDSKYKPLMKRVLYEKYRVTDSTNNSTLESFFKPWYRIRKKVIYMCWIGNECYVLNTECVTQKKNIEIEIAHNPDKYIETDYLDEEVTHYIETKKELPQKIKSLFNQFYSQKENGN